MAESLGVLRFFFYEEEKREAETLSREIVEFKNRDLKTFFDSRSIEHKV